MPKLIPNTQLLRAIQGPPKQQQFTDLRDLLYNSSRALEATIQDLKTKIGQLAFTINELIQQCSGTLPAQPAMNPKVGENEEA